MRREEEEFLKKLHGVQFLLLRTFSCLPRSSGLVIAGKAILQKKS